MEALWSGANRIQRRGGEEEEEEEAGACTGRVHREEEHLGEFSAWHGAGQ